MDKPFIAYAGIDKITIGNGRNGKAYDVSVELAAAAPALLAIAKWTERLEQADGSVTFPPKTLIEAARAAIAQAKGERQ